MSTTHLCTRSFFSAPIENDSGVSVSLTSHCMFGLFAGLHLISCLRLVYPCSPLTDVLFFHAFAVVASLVSSSSPISYMPLCHFLSRAGLRWLLVATMSECMATAVTLAPSPSREPTIMFLVSDGHHHRNVTHRSVMSILTEHLRVLHTVQ